MSEALPAGLAAALAERGARLVERWREGRRSYLLAEAPAGRLFARWSEAPGDLALLAHEAKVRAIVGAEGPLRAPPVLALGAGWLLERAVEPGPFSGAAELVVAAAARVSELELPQPPAAALRQDRTGPLRRRLLALSSPVPVRDLVAARAALRDSALPVRTSHGDFHVGNVLLAGGAAWVVDWELCGRRPFGYDLMQYWATLREPEQRARLFEAAVALVGERRRRELERLRYALAVTTAADKLGSLREFNRDDEGARELLALLPALRPYAGGRSARATRKSPR